MSGYDRTGPLGNGSRTGGGLGRCGRPADGTRPVGDPSRDEGDEGEGRYGRRRGGGRGRSFGRGGRGRRWGFRMGRRAINDPAASDVTPRRRQAFLRRQIRELTKELDRVNQFLSEDSREGAQDEA